MFLQNVSPISFLTQVLFIMSENNLYDILHEFVSCKDESGCGLPIEQIIDALLTKYKSALNENAEMRKKLYSFCVANPYPHNKNIVYESSCELVEHLCDLFSQKVRESQSFQNKMIHYCKAFDSLLDENTNVRIQLTKSFKPGSCINLSNEQIASNLTQHVLDLRQEISVMKMSDKT